MSNTLSMRMTERRSATQHGDEKASAIRHSRRQAQIQSGGASRPVRHACVMILIVRRTKFFSCAFVFSKGITVWGCGLDYDGISYSHGFLVLGSRRWREQQTGFPPAGKNDGLGRQCESQSVTFFVAPKVTEKNRQRNVNTYNYGETAAKQAQWQPSRDKVLVSADE